MEQPIKANFLVEFRSGARKLYMRYFHREELALALDALRTLRQRTTEAGTRVIGAWIA